jgi:DNA-binding transcriptional MerR regulator
MDIEQLATLSATPRRTIRFYVQEGLLPPPDGERRGARYSDTHLERLLAIRRLQQDGLSLEAIRRRLSGDVEQDFVPPRVGSVEVWSRIHVRDGVEIHIEPGRSRLSAEQIRQLAARVRDWMEQTASSDEGQSS